ncbi:MAG: hypothetical protein ABGZ53_03010 [Fuerstiella sp.]
MATFAGHVAVDLAPWPPIRQHFVRTFGVLAIGVGVLLASLVPAMAIGSTALVFGLLAMGGIGIVWNLCTVALLPVAISSRLHWLQAIRKGIMLSWALKARWWKQLRAHLVLLGLVVFLRVHFTTTVALPNANVTHQTKTNVNCQVNAFWVGGYENRCRWNTKYAAALETKQVPIITKVLSLLFLVMAVAMKLTVIRELDHKAKSLADKSDSQPPSATLDQPFG